MIMCDRYLPGGFYIYITSSHRSSIALAVKNNKTVFRQRFPPCADLNQAGALNDAVTHFLTKQMMTVRENEAHSAQELLRGLDNIYTQSSSGVGPIKGCRRKGPKIYGDRE